MEEKSKKRKLKVVHKEFANNNTSKLIADFSEILKKIESNLNAKTQEDENEINNKRN